MTRRTHNTTPPPPQNIFIFSCSSLGNVLHHYSGNNMGTGGVMLCRVKINIVEGGGGGHVVCAAPLHCTHCPVLHPPSPPKHIYFPLPFMGNSASPLFGEQWVVASCIRGIIWEQGGRVGGWVMSAGRSAGRPTGQGRVCCACKPEKRTKRTGTRHQHTPPPP